MKNLFPLILILFSLSLSAQDYKSFAIKNVSEEEVWPALYKTLLALKLPKVNVNKTTGVGETGFYDFTALMIKNRCRLRFEYSAGTLTVSIFGRQYLSEKGWVDNMLPMTKKQASKLLDPIEEQLSSLSDSEPAASNQTAAKATQQPLTSNSEKAGVYDDFVIIKTDDPGVELLAIHGERQILGFDLYDDQKTVRSLVFLEDEDAEAITMLFDEEGFPAGMITPGFILEITREGSTGLHLALFDLEGTFIREGKIAWEKPQPTGMVFPGEEQGHGPFPANEPVMFEDADLADYMGYASTALQVVSCAALVGSGAGIPIAAVTCGSALLDLTVRALPRENIFYDDLALLSEAAALIQLKDPYKGIKLVSRIKLLETLDRSGKLTTGLKNFINGGWNLYEKHFSPGNIRITRPAAADASQKVSGKEISAVKEEDMNPPKPVITMGGENDRQTIILLAHEAMGKIQANNDKIEALQKVVNETNYLKIGTEIKELEEQNKHIRADYGDRIKTIAEKGTVSIPVKKTDPAPYYNIGGIKVAGAHWENSWLVLLISVDLQKTPVPKTVNGKRIYETLGDLRFQYLDREGRFLQKGTALFTRFGMNFDTFEKVGSVEFLGSNPVLRENPSQDQVDQF